MYSTYILNLHAFQSHFILTPIYLEIIIWYNALIVYMDVFTLNILKCKIPACNYIFNFGHYIYSYTVDPSQPYPYPTSTAAEVLCNEYEHNKCIVLISWFKYIVVKAIYNIVGPHFLLIASEQAAQTFLETEWATALMNQLDIVDF